MSLETILATRANHVVGQWGELEYVKIVIAPPLEFVSDVMGGTDSTQWHLAAADASQLEAVLSQAGISPAERNRLLGTLEFDNLGGCQCAPGMEFIRALEPEARKIIYTWLAASPINSPHSNAFRFCGESASEWLEDAGLKDSTIERVLPYIFLHGSFQFFADLHAVMPQISDRAERISLVKALSREVTMLVKLHIRPDSNMEQVIGYWGRGRRNKDIRPILESLARFREGQTIDAVHLLPPFARRLLYTYPSPPRGTNDLARDCHWTSLNFFNEIPSDSYLDLNNVVRTIESDFHRIYFDMQFGDLVLLCSESGEVFHSAIHLADDVVFTKNGPTMSRPWMFMHLSQIRDFYPRRHPIQVRYYRRRDLM